MSPGEVSRKIQHMQKTFLFAVSCILKIKENTLATKVLATGNEIWAWRRGD